ncbi:hypothetical protein [Nocardioides sp. SYSU DS0663]|uniref:hypothetical protein n=1 Tax=Nocardioides sp. SYSU DS0663 TaxID=3416445 RepID=UPI003F4B6CD1
MRGRSCTSGPAPWAYLWWAVTGALVAFGVLSLLSIGVLLLAAAVPLVVVGVLSARLRNIARVAALAGAAVAPLFLAWSNRDGPGTVCRTLPDGSACEQQWSPWPFLVVAVGLVAVSVGAVVAARRRRA